MLSFPRGTKMFQFPRFPPHRLCVQRWVTVFPTAGFPHSDIAGLAPAHGSPTLFAVYHVLLRLLTPRHPPFAFSSFFVMRSPQSFIVLLSLDAHLACYSLVKVPDNRLRLLFGRMRLSPFPSTTDITRCRNSLCRVAMEFGIAQLPSNRSAVANGPE